MLLFLMLSKPAHMLRTQPDAGGLARCYVAFLVNECGAVGCQFADLGESTARRGVSHSGIKCSYLKNGAYSKYLGPLEDKMYLGNEKYSDQVCGVFIDCLVLM